LLRMRRGVKLGGEEYITKEPMHATYTARKQLKSNHYCRYRSGLSSQNTDSRRHRRIQVQHLTLHRTYHSILHPDMPIGPPTPVAGYAISEHLDQRYLTRARFARRDSVVNAIPANSRIDQLIVLGSRKSLNVSLE
jgi:hypothetical protein